MEERYLRLSEVCIRTACSPATIYRYVKAGRFPAQRQLGENSVAWLLSEVEHWIRSRPIKAANEN